MKEPIPSSIIFGKKLVASNIHDELLDYFNITKSKNAIGCTSFRYNKEYTNDTKFGFVNVHGNITKFQAKTELIVAGEYFLDNEELFPGENKTILPFMIITPYGMEILSVKEYEKDKFEKDISALRSKISTYSEKIKKADEWIESLTVQFQIIK